MSFDLLGLLGYIRLLIEFGVFSWSFNVLQLLSYIRVFI